VGALGDSLGDSVVKEAWRWETQEGRCQPRTGRELTRFVVEHTRRVLRTGRRPLGEFVVEWVDFLGRDPWLSCGYPPRRAERQASRAASVGRSDKVARTRASVASGLPLHWLELERTKGAEDLVGVGVATNAEWKARGDSCSGASSRAASEGPRQRVRRREEGERTRGSAAWPERVGSRRWRQEQWMSWCW